MNQKNTNNYIGILDSGFGGLSVTSDLLALSELNIFYYADFANSPYGNKTRELVQSKVREAVEFLISLGANAILLACNTATSVAVDYLRSKIKIPVFGMEPAIKPALRNSNHEKILVLATELTLKEDKFLSLRNKMDPMNRVIAFPCPGLSNLIDNYQFEEAIIYVSKILLDPNYQGIHHIVLGCTHYLYLLPNLKEKFPNHYFYDGNLGTVRHVMNSINIPTKPVENLDEFFLRVKSVQFFQSGTLPTNNKNINFHDWLELRYTNSKNFYSATTRI